MPESRKLRVFLCHSSQDKPIVRELYQKLFAEGWIDPWLDEEKLLPGQDWGMEIEKAVEDSDVVIVCLSNNSVTKEGYVQRELKFVLDIALEKPEETIFIIPLRLDDIQPPRRLRFWHYINYFPLEQRQLSYEKIQKSFKLRLKQIDGTDFGYKEQDDIKSDFNTKHGLNNKNNFEVNEKEVIDSKQSITSNTNIKETKLQVFFIPFSIGLETLNGIFTPVISKGDKLPVEKKVVFSTAEDNQKRVEIHVLLGENKSAKDNLSLGKFSFENILPALKAVPQIEFQFKINQQLELEFVVVELISGRIKNYEPISLKGMLSPPIIDPFSTNTDDNNVFSKFFGSIFNTAPVKNEEDGHYRQDIVLTLEEAGLGTNRQIQVEDKKYLVKIPAGVNSGSKIRVNGVMLNQNGSKGDLYLEVTVIPHKLFERIDSDLYMRYPISAELALRGGELPVRELGKSKIMIKIPPRTQNKQTFRFPGKGLPNLTNPEQFGVFYITVEIYNGENISQEHKILLDLINDYLN